MADLYLSDQLSLIDSIRRKSMDVEKLLKEEATRISLPNDATSLATICAGATVVWIFTVVCCAACIRRQRIFGAAPQSTENTTSNTVHYTAIYNQVEKETEQQYYPLRELPDFPSAPAPVECSA